MNMTNKRELLAQFNRNDLIRFYKIQFFAWAAVVLILRKAAMGAMRHQEGAERKRTVQKMKLCEGFFAELLLNIFCHNSCHDRDIILMAVRPPARSLFGDQVGERLRVCPFEAV